MAGQPTIKYQVYGPGLAPVGRPVDSWHQADSQHQKLAEANPGQVYLVARVEFLTKAVEA